jgi:hypothetical protein
MNDETLVLFLDWLVLDSGSTIRGGALVTNAMTEPVEFRCTSPVRPTVLQRVLWGERVTGHLAVRTIGKALVDGMTSPFRLVLVRKPEFLGLRELIQAPVVLLSTGADTDKAAVPLTQSANASISSPNPDKSSLVGISVHGQFVMDREIARPILAEMGRNCSLLEPFERVVTALRLIHEHETKHGGTPT